MTTRGRIDSFTALASTIEAEKAKHIEAGERAFLVFLAAAVARYAAGDRVSALAFARAAVSLLEGDFSAPKPEVKPEPQPAPPPEPEPTPRPRPDGKPTFAWFGPDDLIDRKTAAALLNLSPTTLAGWAVRGGGPVMTKMGRAVRYRIADLLEWVEAQAKQSTTK